MTKKYPPFKAHCLKMSSGLWRVQKCPFWTGFRIHLYGVLPFQFKEICQNYTFSCHSISPKVLVTKRSFQNSKIVSYTSLDPDDIFKEGVHE